MAVPTLEQLTTRVFELLCERILVPHEAFCAQSDLIEAGLDSLSVTRLLLAIEEFCGLEIDESELTREDLATAQALAERVHGQLSRA